MLALDELELEIELRERQRGLKRASSPRSSRAARRRRGHAGNGGSSGGGGGRGRRRRRRRRGALAIRLDSLRVDEEDEAAQLLDTFLVCGELASHEDDDGHGDSGSDDDQISRERERELARGEMGVLGFRARAKRARGRPYPPWSRPVAPGVAHLRRSWHARARRRHTRREVEDDRRWAGPATVATGPKCTIGFPFFFFWN